MTHEEFTGVAFNDLEPSATRISRSSEFSVVNSTQITLNIPHKVHILWSSSYLRLLVKLSHATLTC